MSLVTAVLAAVSASAILGLMVAPAPRSISWARTACALALLCSLGLLVLTGVLMVVGEWQLPVYTLIMAGAVLYPAWWLGRTSDQPPAAADVDADEEDDSGGGGGGLRKPPGEPPPSPPTSGLDWDAFDRERETWTVRERKTSPV